MKNANTKRSSAKSRAKSFTTWAAGIMLAASLLFIGLLTGCPNAAGSNGGDSGVPTAPLAPVVQGGASLILSPGTSVIKVLVVADGGVTVEGCTQVVLNSGVKTTLNATGNKIILKGKITYLDCDFNQLTRLNVQGLTQLQTLHCGANELISLDVQGSTQLQELYCGGNELRSLNVQGLTQLKTLKCNHNQFNEAAFTAILNALPARELSDNAICCLFFEDGDEQNYKFTGSVPDDLKTAFENARAKHWSLKKFDASHNEYDITLP